MADGMQDMVSFRARLDDHHVLLTNQSAGAYYVGVYNNDNYMKVRGHLTSKCFAMHCVLWGGQRIDFRQACPALACVSFFSRSFVRAQPSWPPADASPAHMRGEACALAVPSRARATTGTASAIDRVLMRVKRTLTLTPGAAGALDAGPRVDKVSVLFWWGP